MKKTLLLLTFNLMLLVSVFAQPKRLNLNDDTALSLKSAGVVNNFDVAIKKSRPFALNPIVRNHSNVAVGDTLQLALFPGKDYLSVIQSKTTDVNGTTVLVAKLTGFQFAFCLISISEQAFLVTVDIPELNEKYSTRFISQNKSQYMVQLDENKLDILEDGHISTETIDSLRNSILPKGITSLSNRHKGDANGLKSAQLNSTADDSAQIDILVVYTTTAKEWADTYEGGINNSISLAMANCNLVSKNSKLGINFTLVHSTEVGYAETKDSYVDINNLTDGLIPNIYNIRDIVAADLVILLTKTDDVGGISWQLDNRDGKEDYGYLIVRVQEASGYNTIHELGHDLGANHPIQQNKEPGPTKWINFPENTWSAGWRWKGDDNQYYCDVMSYEPGFYFPDGITHTQVPYFSDPDILFQGQPTGDSVDGNNARTIREMKHVVAAYREVKHQSTPTVYTVNLHDITLNGVVSGGVITNEGVAPVTARGIVWSTNQMPTLNDHFTVDGSGTGYFKSQLTGLEITTTYYVRAYATNSAGTTYGNQVVFIHNGGVQSDFITRWELPSGQDKLGFFIDRNENVAYKWETIPAGQSGSGIFPPGIGLVEINDLPEGQIIRVYLAPDNLTRFYNYYMICPYPAILGPDRENLLDVEQWGTMQWNSTRYAFYGCNRLNISANDTPEFSYVTNMSYMFFGCNSLNKIDKMNNWTVSSVKDMSNMFSDAKLFNENIGDWDVSKVTNMNSMFFHANSFNQDISRWDVSKVTDMMNMFVCDWAFNQNIGKWDVSNVTDMTGMFGYATNFNQDIGKWNVSKVIGMYGMFSSASSFNQDIGSWDVSSVRSMCAMFQGPTIFNHNIGGWDVSKVVDMSNMFSYSTAFNQDISSWNVSSVKWMMGMFGAASAFNKDIGQWDVSSVSDLSWMFWQATAFDQDISKWNVTNVENMEYMFTGARAFNQDIGGWNITGVKYMENMFDFCGMNCSNYSTTITGWSENPNTPDSLTLGAAFMHYDCNAIEARTILTSNKKWNIIGDQQASSVLQVGTISGETTVCQGQKIATYMVPEIENATSYIWNLPRGATGTSTTNTIAVDFDSTAISGYITVKGINSCGESAPSSLPITVNKIPYLAGAISGETTVCQGQKAVTYSIPEIENATSYVWTLPNGATGTSTTNTIAVDFDSSAVSGYITVKGINSCGESAPSSSPIIVNKIPYLAGAISGETTVCSGQKAVFYTTPEIENATTYFWTLPNGATGKSTTNTIAVDFDSTAISGNITVKGINVCGESAESVLPITINSTPPTPAITFTNKVLLSDATEGNQWYNKNGAIANATNKEFFPKVNGEYYVVVSRLGCNSKPSNSINASVVGIETMAGENRIRVYPNPVTNELTIEMEGNTAKIGFEIIDAIGQTVFKGNMVNQTKVQTDSFAPGTYLIKIENGGAFEFSKIIKK